MTKTPFLWMLPFLLTAGTARAQSAAAEQLFRDASALLTRGDVHAACVKLVESQKLEPQLGTLLNVASCHEKEGKVATAWTEYSELVDAATAKGDAKRVKYARRKVAELDKQLPRLQLDVPAATAELRLDGAALGSGAWSTSLPVDPGDHEIAYSGAGKKPATQHVTASMATVTRVALAPLVDADPPPPAPVAAAPAMAPTPAPPPFALPAARTGATASPVRTAGFVVGAVGIGGLAVGGAFGALALAAKGDVTSGCKGNQCTQAGLSAVDTARGRATASTLGFVVGAVCLAGGVTMVLVGGRQSAEVAVVPTGEAHGAGMAVVGRF